MQKKITIKGYYLTHSFFNAISFNIVLGNILTLYALALGANALVIGILSSLTYLSLVAPILGRLFIQRLGAARQFTTFWFLRYLSLIPMVFLFIPFFIERIFLTFAIIIISQTLFSLFKGIAISCNQAIIGEIVNKNNAGNFISLSTMMGTLGGVLTTLTASIFIGETPSLMTYSIIYAIGICSGFISVFCVSHFPEPRVAAKNYGITIKESLHEMTKNKPFILFTFVMGLITFAFTVSGPFLIVFYRQYYGQPANKTLLFNMIAGIGSIIIVYLVRKYLNTHGAKKPIIVTTITKTLLLFILITAPTIDLPSTAFIFIAVLSIGLGMSDGGRNLYKNVYFLSITKPSQRINYSIINNMIFGISGVLGSLLGGTVLQTMNNFGYSIITGFRTVFITSVVFYIISIFFTLKLKNIKYGDTKGD